MSEEKPTKRRKTDVIFSVAEELKARVASLESANAKLIKDIEQGFMPGAYARLQHLQEAERKCAAMESANAELKRELADTQRALKETCAQVAAFRVRKSEILSLREALRKIADRDRHEIEDSSKCDWAYDDTPCLGCIARTALAESALASDHASEANQLP